MSALTDVFTAIANAIRNKNGGSATYKPSQMAGAINDLQTGGTAYAWQGQNGDYLYLDKDTAPLNSSDATKQLDIDSGGAIQKSNFDFTVYSRVSASSFVAPSKGRHWTAETSGISSTLREVCFGNNLFVAVGDSGTILTSPDGVNWTSRTSGTIANLQSVCFGNNLFVAVGESGTILTSIQTYTRDSTKDLVLW